MSFMQPANVRVRLKTSFCDRALAMACAAAGAPLMTVPAASAELPAMMSLRLNSVASGIEFFWR
jgi:hypothetical protein